MSENDQDQKTEAPTEKRLTEAWERGEFARSPELQVVVIMTVTLVVLSFTLATAARDLTDLTVNIFGELSSLSQHLDTVPVRVTEIGIVAARILLPVLGATVVAACLAGGFQSGFRLSPKALGVKFDKLNPIAGFSRLCNKDVFVHAGIDLLKVIAIGIVLWAGARGLMRDPIFSVPVEVAYLGDFMHRASYSFFSRMLLALGVIAGTSYAYEKFRSHQKMMMTKQEVKEEHKQAEGNQKMKASMRRMARRLVQKQMLEAVATADVVVTNPTHFAVALKYERGVDNAPIVLAKGENRFARRIKEIAAQHSVPVVENKPVARMLYAIGKVGESIPSELYQTVAEILAFVYRTHRYYFHALKTRRMSASSALSVA